MEWEPNNTQTHTNIYYIRIRLSRRSALRCVFFFACPFLRCIFVVAAAVLLWAEPWISPSQGNLVCSAFSRSLFIEFLCCYTRNIHGSEGFFVREIDVFYFVVSRYWIKPIWTTFVICLLSLCSPPPCTFLILSISGAFLSLLLSSIHTFYLLQNQWNFCCNFALKPL